jgi:hypothetical protein
LPFLLSVSFKQYFSGIVIFRQEDFLFLTLSEFELKRWSWARINKFTINIFIT